MLKKQGLVSSWSERTNFWAGSLERRKQRKQSKAQEIFTRPTQMNANATTVKYTQHLSILHPNMAEKYPVFPFAFVFAFALLRFTRTRVKFKRNQPKDKCMRRLKNFVLLSYLDLKIEVAHTYVFLLQRCSFEPTLRFLRFRCVTEWLSSFVAGLQEMSGSKRGAWRERRIIQPKNDLIRKPKCRVSQRRTVDEVSILKS